VWAKGPLTTCYGVFELILAPLLDGRHFTRQISDSLDLGLFRKIPLMINTNLDEGQFFVSLKLVDDLEATQDKYLSRLLPYYSQEDFSNLKNIYTENAPFSESNTGLIKIVSDYMFQCPSRKMAKAYSKFGEPVIKSLFTQRIGLFQIPPIKLAVVHGSYFWF
jgi:carboxylesterase type B